jgi:2-aminobenzoate-CoA ligase
MIDTQSVAFADEEYTAHVDTFARDRLPPRDQWPEFRFDLPELQYSRRINCGAALLDEAITEGCGARVALYSRHGNWTYYELLERANRIANVLIEDLGVVPGNRVLLRGANTPTLVASWLAVMKAGAIAVTTMPMLRAKELCVMADRAQVDHALCDARLAAEVHEAARATGRLSRVLTYGDGTMERLMARRTDEFRNVPTSRDDVCLLAFTSGTTGNPKATMHFHRDVLVMRDVVGRHLLETAPDDIYTGSPPLGFTFGLGALLVFPLGARAAVALVEQPTPENLLDAIGRFRATALFTAPTAYRALVPLVPSHDLSSLRRCISAGEALPKATSDAWHAATGLRIIDGIGATEMIHIFISAKGADIRPGATGKPLPGYEACVLDEQGKPLPRPNAGRLAVKGPSGCRYLDDARQREYVQNGWNVTGDRYYVDAEGYFWFQARADDMIISGGYNIAGPEVEAALLEHPAVRECAVVGAQDERRGQIVKAFVVVGAGHTAGDELARELQEHVKRSIAPYKYPRAVEFVTELPKTATGKLQRYVLRQRCEQHL